MNRTTFSFKFITFFCLSSGVLLLATPDLQSLNSPSPRAEESYETTFLTPSFLCAVPCSDLSSYSEGHFDDGQPYYRTDAHLSFKAQFSSAHPPLNGTTWCAHTQMLTNSQGEHFGYRACGLFGGRCEEHAAYTSAGERTEYHQTLCWPLGFFRETSEQAENRSISHLSLCGCYESEGDERCLTIPGVFMATTAPRSVLYPSLLVYKEKTKDTQGAACCGVGVAKTAGSWGPTFCQSPVRNPFSALSRTIKEWFCLNESEDFLDVFLEGVEADSLK